MAGADGATHGHRCRVAAEWRRYWRTASCSAPQCDRESPGAPRRTAHHVTAAVTIGRWIAAAVTAHRRNPRREGAARNPSRRADRVLSDTPSIGSGRDDISTTTGDVCGAITVSQTATRRHTNVHHTPYTCALTSHHSSSEPSSLGTAGQHRM